jgi:hypothetical protein
MYSNPTTLHTYNTQESNNNVTSLCVGDHEKTFYIFFCIYLESVQYINILYIKQNKNFFKQSLFILLYKNITITFCSHKIKYKYFFNNKNFPTKQKYLIRMIQKSNHVPGLSICFADIFLKDG